ncbi:MAG TPA: SCO family protein, partial [Longimicrobiales bacterium]|nr:SCO family protein [Longimicrobiales bacterium]
ALVVVVVVMTVAQRRVYDFHGTYFDPAAPAADFTLRSADGPVHLSDFAGKVVVLYFGYTYCPDVCPTTLDHLARALHAAGDPNDVQVLFITVDPARDDAARMAEYVHQFSPDFIGLTASQDTIDAVAKAYGIYHKKSDDSDTHYTIDHTATITVVGRKGLVRLLWPPDLTPQQMAQDLEALRRR